MYILQRYIIRQHIGPFVFGFFVIVLVWILNLLFTRLGNMLSRGLSIGVILEFFALNLAWIIALTVPMAILMACLMAFGRMSSDYEITAMKASGVSIYQMLMPMLFIGMLLCMFLIWFNNYVLPDANHRLALLARDISKKRPTISIEPGIIYRELPNIHLLVKEVVEHENRSDIIGVLIYDRRDVRNNKVIIAKNGEIYVDEKAGLFRMTLYQCEMHELTIEKLKNYRRTTFDKLLITIPIPDMVLQRSNSDYRSDREQSADSMRKEIATNKKLLVEKNSDLNAYIISHLQRYFSPADQHGESLQQPVIFDPHANLSSSSVLHNMQKQIRVNKNILQRIQSNRQLNEHYLIRISKLSVEVHKKYSIPFASIIFVLVGVPLGVMARRGGMAVGGGISLLFFLVYWISLIGGEELADRRIVSPFIAMWLANILVGVMGIYLVFHSAKELATFRIEDLKLLIPKRYRQE
jgi:lipopolysaccharide export system permease protein